MSNPAYITESYLTAFNQREVADAWVNIIDNLWCNSGGRLRRSTGVKDWDKTKMLWHLDNPQDFDSKGYVQFTGLHYESSIYHRGKPVVTREDAGALPGHIYVIDLAGFDNPVHFERDEAVTLSHSRSVSTDDTTAFDIKAGSETTVGGSFAGVSLEEKISVETGYSNTKERQEGEDEGKDESESVNIDTQLTEGRRSEIEIVAVPKVSDTPLDIDLVQTYGFRVKFPQRYTDFGPDAPHNAAHLTSGKNTRPFLAPGDGRHDHPETPEFVWRTLNDVAAWVHGYDIHWLGMAGYYDALSAHYKAEWTKILGPQHRRISISTTETVHSEADPDWTLSDVTDVSDDDLADAQVLNPDDL